MLNSLMGECTPGICSVTCFDHLVLQQTNKHMDCSMEVARSEVNQEILRTSITSTTCRLLTKKACLEEEKLSRSLDRERLQLSKHQDLRVKPMEVWTLKSKGLKIMISLQLKYSLTKLYKTSFHICIGLLAYTVLFDPKGWWWSSNLNNMKNINLIKLSKMASFAYKITIFNDQ